MSDVPLPQPSLPQPLDTVVDQVTSVLAPSSSPSTSSGSTSTSSTPQAPTSPFVPALPGLGGSTSGTSSSGTTSSSTSDAPLAPIGEGVKSALNQLDAGTADTPLAPLVPDGSTGSVADLDLDLSPLATACAQVTGSGTAVANLDVTVGGQNITRPVVDALPGLLAPCPAGSGGAENPGGTVDISDGFVGLCLSAESAPPLKGSIIAADTDLIAELTKAGIPLQELVVPCPTGAPGTGGGGGDNGGGGTTNPGDGSGGTGGSGGSGQTGGSGNGSGSGDSGTSGGSAAGAGSGVGTNGNECAINASPAALQTPAGDAANLLPWALLLLVALGRQRLTNAVATVRRVRVTRA